MQKHRSLGVALVYDLKKKELFRYFNTREIETDVHNLFYPGVKQKDTLYSNLFVEV